VGLDREFRKEFISHLRTRVEVRYTQFQREGMVVPITKDIFISDTILAMENQFRLEYVVI